MPQKNMQSEDSQKSSGTRSSKRRSEDGEFSNNEGTNTIRLSGKIRPAAKIKFCSTIYGKSALAKERANDMVARDKWRRGLSLWCLCGGKYAIGYKNLCSNFERICQYDAGTPELKLVTFGKYFRGALFEVIITIVFWSYQRIIKLLYLNTRYL